jgi:hypothetical protein
MAVIAGLYKPLSAAIGTTTNHAYMMRPYDDGTDPALDPTPAQLRAKLSLGSETLNIRRI